MQHMILHTCSEVISFARKLETESANFYDNLSQKYTQNGDIFISFAKDNGKNVLQVERSYYGAISDALEGCFTYDVKPDAYTFKTDIAGNVSYSDALNNAIDIEEKMIKFYSDAAEQSKSLMVDIQRAFMMIAKKRLARVKMLRSLIREED